MVGPNNKKNFELLNQTSKLSYRSNIEPLEQWV